MSGRRPRRRLRLAALAGITVALLAAGGRAAPAAPATTAPAAPATGAQLSVAPAAAIRTAVAAADAEVDLTITAVAPQVARPGDTLALAGAVANPDTGTTLESVQVLLRYSRDPLESRSEVRRAADDVDVRRGRRAGDVFDEVVDRLQPGESARWELSLPVDTLRLDDPGIYVVGVDVRGTTRDGRQTLATTRTFLPWLPAGDPPPARVALVWPLAARPTVLPDGTIADPRAAEELTPAGRAGRLLRAAAGAPVTWLADPDLLATAEAAGATDWLAEAGTATGGAAGLAALPVADPDVAAVAHAVAAGAVDPTLAAATLQGSVAGDPAAELGPLAASAPPGTVRRLVWPGSGAADIATLESLAASGVRAVLLRASTVTPEGRGPRARVDAGGGTLDVVLSDPGLDAALLAAGEAGSSEAARTTQRLVAELVQAALDAVADDDPPPELVAAPATRWDPPAPVAAAVVATLTGSPWAVPTGLDQIGTGLTAPEVEVDYPRAAREAELTVGQVARLDGIADAGRAVAALFDEPDPAGAGPAGLRALSTGWRGAPAAAAAFAERVVEVADDAVAGVTVLAPPEITLSSRSGRFPLTIVNNLDRAVTVGLALSPANPDRLAVEEVEPRPVGPGEKATVLVLAEASGNGRLPVAVRLLAPDGSLVGGTARLVVVATDYGTIGWVVVGSAAVLLLVAVADQVRRRRRAHLEEGAGDG